MKTIRNLALFLSICSLLSFKLHLQEKTSTAKIPYFTFYTLDKKPFTKDSLDSDRNKFIFYFNSECEHCEKQGKWLANGIEKNVEEFEDLEMIFISFEERSEIKKYRDKFNFNESNMTFLQDYRLTFSNKFDVETFPSILIYDKKGTLITKFEGETKIENILPFLK